MYLLVYGLSLPPFPSSTPPTPPSIICLLHPPEKPVLEMYAFLNGYPCPCFQPSLLCIDIFLPFSPFLSLIHMFTFHPGTCMFILFIPLCLHFIQFNLRLLRPASSLTWVWVLLFKSLALIWLLGRFCLNIEWNISDCLSIIWFGHNTCENSWTKTFSSTHVLHIIV